MVSLPLAGDVNIWVFQSTPFPANEDLSAIIEHTMKSPSERGIPEDAIPHH